MRSPRGRPAPPTHQHPGTPGSHRPCPAPTPENTHLYYLLEKKGLLSISRAVFATTVAHVTAPSIVPELMMLLNQAAREFRERVKQRRGDECFCFSS